MTDSDKLRGQIKDLGNLIGKTGEFLAQLRRSQTKLKHALAREDPERKVTDHAVVRYLERVRGIDMDEVRTEIRALANEAQEVKGGDHYWHPDGVILIIGDDAQVVTILGAEQVEKYAGRKLTNGEYIPSDDPA